MAISSLIIYLNVGNNVGPGKSECLFINRTKALFRDWWITTKDESSLNPFQWYFKKWLSCSRTAPWTKKTRVIFSWLTRLTILFFSFSPFWQWLHIFKRTFPTVRVSWEARIPNKRQFMQKKLIAHMKDSVSKYHLTLFPFLISVSDLASKNIILFLGFKW